MSSREADLECETVIRWDRTAAPAVLWTADRTEATRWRRLGYPVEAAGEGGWSCRVPVACVALLRLVGGTAKIPRWLEPPVVRAPATKAPGAPEAEKAREITKQTA